MAFSALRVRVVFVAALRTEADRPCKRLEQGRFAGAILADEKRHRRREFETEAIREQRCRERMHTRLNVFVLQSDCREERAAKQGRTGAFRGSLWHVVRGLLALTLTSESASSRSLHPQLRPRDEHRPRHRRSTVFAPAYAYFFGRYAISALPGVWL